jgi:Fic family protein
MMLDATQNYAQPLTAHRLFVWHRSLFPDGGARRIVTGAWRPHGSPLMQVVSGPVGSERVRFEAPAGERIETEMRAFLDWFNAPPTADPVLRAGIAHFWFVTIHPFEDGNGRIARAIADMSLARADGTPHRFYSMSSQIAAERAEYYRRLESAQRADVDITSWLSWFLACLDRAIDAAEALLAAGLRKADLWHRINPHPVNERQRLVINRLLDDFKGFLTTSKYAKLARCSDDTALRDIRELVERGVLVQNPGGGRSTSYRLADGG